MKNGYFVLAGLALLACIPLLTGNEPDNKQVQQLMKKKLQYAQKVLEGIALNDYDQIAKNAEDLTQLSKAVEWRVYRSPKYEIHSNEFRRSTEALVEAARVKNVDAAALAYVDLTLTCVRCHKHVRDVRHTDLGPQRDNREAPPE
jgi:hypothetical protein